MDYMSLFFGTIGLATGLPRVIAPRRSLQLAQQDHAKRLAEIEAGAPERFHEEYRALKAYPVPSSDRKWVAIGWLFVVFGLVSIVAGLLGRDAVHALLS
ncbi:hypothetical protein [Novosphingobium sp.]|uniref:hypothetical protein n=1 Tax=Novosphingobium sp. TaxID=1874826 RepID=UPI00261D1F9A|nr:hypothetical protein [Novosphingobium sp.]